MTTHNFIRAFAGSMLLLSLALATWVSPYWLWFTTFIGLNLLQSAFTGFCPPTLVLRKLGWVDSKDVIHWGQKVS